MRYVSILQTIGHERMRQSEPDKAYDTFAESGAAARKFLETKPDVPESVHSLLAAAFYNDACAAARQKNTDAAVVSLEESFRWGFSDLSLLETDEDLASVRELGSFQQKLEEWKKAAREAAARVAKKDLASGEPFPFDFALTDVTGKPIKLADYQGKVVIVDLWGTWCPPCRAEIPSFVKLQETFGEKGFQMIGLNQENETGEAAIQKVSSFIAEHHMNYPCAIIDDATLKQVPDLEGFPTTLFLDRTGKVRLKVVGLHEYAYLEAVVLALLDEPASQSTPAQTPAAGEPAAPTSR
jgi:thiol-disulfide isomerase/thioredoxin